MFTLSLSCLDRRNYIKQHTFLHPVFKALTFFCVAGAPVKVLLSGGPSLRCEALHLTVCEDTASAVGSLVREALHALAPSPPQDAPSAPLAPGDQVTWKSSDKDVAAGTVGTVRRVYSDGDVEVEFPGRAAPRPPQVFTFPEERLNRWQPPRRSAAPPPGRSRVLATLRGCELSCALASPLAAEGASAVRVAVRGAVGAVQVVHCGRAGVGRLAWDTRPAGPASDAGDATALPAHNATALPSPFCSFDLTLVSPDEAMIEVARDLTGLSVGGAARALPRAAPELHCRLAAGQAEADVALLLRAARVAEAALGTLAAAAELPPGPTQAAPAQLPQAQPPSLNPEAAALPFSPTALIIHPSVDLATWRVWVSPHLFVTTPRVVIKPEQAASEACLSVCVQAIGGSCVMVPMP